ncbi:hypothetical protein CBL_07965 [Carabus blaptoides fortunei]
MYKVSANSNVDIHNTSPSVDCPYYLLINIPRHAFARGLATVCADAIDTKATVADDAVDLQETKSSLVLENKRTILHIIYFIIETNADARVLSGRVKRLYGDLVRHKDKGTGFPQPIELKSACSEMDLYWRSTDTPVADLKGADDLNINN